MKKLSAILIILLALLTIVACNGDTQGPDQNNDSEDYQQAIEDSNLKIELEGRWTTANGDYYAFDKNGDVKYKIGTEQEVSSKYTIYGGVIFIEKYIEEEPQAFTYIVNGKTLTLEQDGDGPFIYTSKSNSGIYGKWNETKAERTTTLVLDKNLNFKSIYRPNDNKDSIYQIGTFTVENQTITLFFKESYKYLFTLKEKGASSATTYFTIDNNTFTKQ